MENKYFIPSIEDIRVGYECESFDDRLQDPNNIKWVKHVLDDWEEIQYIIEDLSWRVRVPYLTKEQIEVEGWECIFEDGDMAFKKNDIRFDLCIDGYRASFQSESVWVNENIIIANIECKDINTFRQIIKLLGV